MATVVWEGGAPAVAKVVTVTVGGTVEVGDVFIVTMGNAILTHVAASTTLSVVADAIATAWNLLDATTHPQFAEITALGIGDGTFTLTADTAGKDFSVVLTTTEAGGGAADDQTFTQADTIGNSGPNDWSTAVNWSTGAVPVNADDVVLADSTVSILYGLAQSAVTLTSLNRDQSYTGVVGLARTNTDGTNYVEYRDTYLAVGVTTAVIGDGAGIGSGRFKLDTGSVQTTIFVNDTGDQLEDALGAVIWKGTHASNVMQVTKGTVSVAPFAGELATIATLTIGFLNNIESDAFVECGDGCTLTNIDKGGGQLFIENDATLITQTGGDTTVKGAATVTTLDLDGGTYFYKSSGTMTTARVGINGTLDFRRDMRARTITNASIHAGGVIRDTSKTVTWTNGIDLVRCSPGDVTLDIGTHLTLTPAAI